MATMADLDRLARGMPHTTKELSDEGRPAYSVHGKLFCCHRGRRRDAVDSESGERLDDVLMFRVADLGVKELLLADDRGVFIAGLLPGCVRSGTLPGAAATQIPSATRATARAVVKRSPQGTIFWTKMTAATRAIQKRLITPSANSTIIRPQQHPTQ